MIRKLIAIAFAILINGAVLAWFNASNTAVATVVPSAHRAVTVLTLPAITVRPTRAQIEMLRMRRNLPPAPRTSASSAPVDGYGMQTLVMPYYSFAGDIGAAGNG